MIDNVMIGLVLIFQSFFPLVSIVIWLVGWLVVEFMANCLTRDLGQWVGCPPWGFF